MRRKLMGVLCLLPLALAACAFGDLRGATSGAVGCAPEDISIDSDTPGWNQRSWTATCRGRRFACSGVARAGYQCTEMREAVAVESLVSSGAAAPTGRP